MCKEIVKEATLVSGEIVCIESNCLDPNHVLVRMGDDLVVGIGNGRMYVYKLVEGIYRYLGDIHLKKQGDAIEWQICTSMADNPWFKKQAAFVAKRRSDNYVEILSQA